MLFRRIFLAVALAVAVLFASVPAQEQASVSPSLFAGLKWRNIGPHRASGRWLPQGTGASRSPSTWRR